MDRAAIRETRFPLLRLDRIYCRPREALRRLFTDARARQFSDHLPVIADIEPMDRPSAQG